MPAHITARTNHALSRWLRAPGRSAVLASLVLTLIAAATSSAVPAFAADGSFSWANIGGGNQDANVGLSTSKTYLNAVDAGGWGGTVNGVTFSRGNFNSNPSGSTMRSPVPAAPSIAIRSISPVNSEKSSSTSSTAARRRSR